MDTQNVSAQLYYKQLPGNSVDFNCNSNPTVPYLQTCVNNTQSDVAIENAFQKQLDLSEYYKSPMVFNKMKQEYMDRTMENENKPLIDVQDTPVVYNNGPVLKPVGPRDFLQGYLNKSSFGSVSGVTIFKVICLIIALIIFFFLYKSQNNSF